MKNCQIPVLLARHPSALGPGRILISNDWNRCSPHRVRYHGDVANRSGTFSKFSLHSPKYSFIILFPGTSAVPQPLKRVRVTAPVFFQLSQSVPVSFASNLLPDVRSETSLLWRKVNTVSSAIPPSIRSPPAADHVILVRRQSWGLPSRPQQPRNPTTRSLLFMTGHPGIHIRMVPGSSPWRLHANVCMRKRLRCRSHGGRLHLKTFNNCSRWWTPARLGSLTPFYGTICSGAGGVTMSC